MSPQISLIILIIILLVFAYLLRRWIYEVVSKNQASQELLEWLKSTNKRLDDQNQNIISTLQQSTKALNERLDNAARFIASVQKNIGEMSEIGRGMKELQDFLKSPKLRGNLGESILKELLSQMLPKQSFHLQYTFKTGSIVDAAIKTSNGIIPIDSKFPLENFRKMIEEGNSENKKVASKNFVFDVKKHIDSISKKYILTDEGTLDYALMYLPSEAVYYEIVNNSELFEYASSKRVLPVSPVTFYAFLKAILMSFEGQKIELKAKQILRLIRSIQKDYSLLEDNLLLLSKHLSNAYNQMSNVQNSLFHLGQKISSTNLLPES